MSTELYCKHIPVLVTALILIGLLASCWEDVHKLWRFAREYMAKVLNRVKFHLVMNTKKLYVSPVCKSVKGQYKTLARSYFCSFNQF